MRQTLLRILPLFALAAACSAKPTTGSAVQAAATQPGAVAILDSGAVRGQTTGGALAFKGIPYAAPPVGPRRWRAPEPAVPWEGTRTATDFGSPCLQPVADGTVSGAEDCLTLNVWTPAAAAGPAAPRPVLVFFHGGYNVTGSSADRFGSVALYDGAYLAEHGDAVVITANYRLGAMGFLAHPSLEDGKPAGNYGILDQIAALRWVQRNAAAFGGDPSHVMIFGQSAGAFDTCILLASPLTKGLFASAVLQSGGCSAGAAAQAATSAATVASRLGCNAGGASGDASSGASGASGDASSDAADVAACLRGKTADEVINAAPYAEAASGSFYGPIIDGAVLPASPLALITAGDHQHVPVIFGTMGDEMSQLIRHFFPEPVSTEAAYQAALIQFFGKGPAAAIAAAYPSATYPTPDKALQAALGDQIFTCPTRRAARALSASQSEPVRRYVFDHAADDPTWHPLGASHGFDLIFTFHNFPVAASATELALSDTMVGYWSRMGADGDPNGGAAPHWPVFEPAADTHLILDVPVATGTGVRTAQCDFWDRVAGGS